jgi:hypothetical protein
MAHPKRKISKTRRDKRRTHYKATVAQIATSDYRWSTFIPQSLLAWGENVHRASCYR